ncbi:hypothetical protein [Mesoaciditoga lauensis]|uniref:hypothetical protein n=1 Tax=Mesoaciditoga lauensis TaxID=1495039 RepID=UPI0012E0A578|nr:hypothetical protein [Mesoaciditoga lauensis]
MKKDGIGKKELILSEVILSILFYSVLFASSISTSGVCCSKSSLSVTSNIFVLPYCETTTVSYTTPLLPSKRNLINEALQVKKDFLVRLATLEAKLNFNQALIYVNVNRTNILRFMESKDFSGNEKVYRTPYYGSDVYFVVSTRILKAPEGYYFLKVDVKMLNSLVKQWTKSFTYAVPIEFTLLTEENGNTYNLLNDGIKEIDNQEFWKIHNRQGGIR